MQNGPAWLLRSHLRHCLPHWLPGCLAIILVMASLVSYYYYLRVAWYMWFRESAAAEDRAPIALSRSLRIALGVAAAGVFLLGVFPGELLELAERSAAGLLQAPSSVLGMRGGR